MAAQAAKPSISGISGVHQDEGRPQPLEGRQGFPALSRPPPTSKPAPCNDFFPGAMARGIASSSTEKHERATARGADPVLLERSPVRR